MKNRCTTENELKKNFAVECNHILLLQKSKLRSAGHQRLLLIGSWTATSVRAEVGITDVDRQAQWSCCVFTLKSKKQGSHVENPGWLRTKVAAHPELAVQPARTVRNVPQAAGQ